MKYLNLIILLFFVNANAQENKAEEVSFQIIEQVPIYIGCENETDLRKCFQVKIQKHIIENFKYPKKAQKKGIQGKVFVSFVIEKDGTVTIANIRGPHIILENEAKRIIELIPKMTPGTQRGEPVRMTMSIPITFKLN